MTWLATGIAVAAFLLLPVFDRAPIRAVLIVGVSVSCALWHLQWRPVVRNPIEHVAWSFALLSCGWASACVAVQSWRRLRSGAAVQAEPILQLSRLAAILYGVVSVVILAVLLAMRTAVVAAELLNNGPGSEQFAASFTPDGLWSLVCLLIGSTVSILSNRDKRLGACVWALGSMAIAWACLLCAPFEVNGQGAYVRTSALLLLAIGQALWLFLGTLLSGRPRLWIGGAPISPGKADEPGSAVMGDATIPGLRGLRFCSDGLSLSLLLLISYHVVVPSEMAGLGYASSAVLCAGSALLVSASCYMWISRSWSEITAGVGLGHLSLAICSGTTLLALREEMPLREMYPAIFSGMMLGCCLAAGLCAVVALRGFALRDARAFNYLSSTNLPPRSEVGRRNVLPHSDGRASSVNDIPGVALIERLMPTARRFAFLNVALAFMVGILMMMWPRVRSVATMDDSLARVSSGMSAILFLLLVVLWCGRRLRQPVFHVMSVLTVLLAGGFLLIRILPFSSHVG